MLPRAIAELSRSAFEHNLTVLAKHAGVPLLLPVKANAYGHGLASLAPLAARHPQVWGLAVATPTEAEELAQLQLGKPILLLTPAAPEEVPELLRLGVRFHASDWSHVRDLPPRARVHLKVETGLHRLGARPALALEMGRWLAERGMLEGVYTHLASSDDPDPSFSEQQWRRFQAVFSQFPEALIHLSSSGGVLSLGQRPGVHLARPGLAAYGLAAEPQRSVLPLRPVMTLKARINQLQTVEPGETVSYGRLWQAQAETKMAVVGLGYADGYPRHATGKASLLIEGQLRPVLGRICMDQLLVDVSGLEVQVGDWVEIWGAGAITVDQVGLWADMINYEVLTGVGARVRRQVVD